MTKKVYLEAKWSRGSLLFLALFFSLVSYAQETGYLTGRLVDSDSGEPVVFATLRLQGFALGVISDKDGGFRIPIEYKDKGTSLEISCLGYQTQSFPLSGLSAQNSTTIRIKPAAFELNESVVTAKRKRLTSEQIVQYALNNIPSNFPTDNFGLVGYYRDYQLKEEEYINLNEALIEVMDMGFQSLDPINTHFLLYEYKQNKAFEVDSFAAKPYDYKQWDKVALSAEVPSYGGNELILLRVHNAIRNHEINSYSYVNRIRKDFIPRHDFKLRGVTDYDNKKVYEIGISMSTNGFWVDGRLYIDQNTFGIRRMDYSVYKATRTDRSREDALKTVRNRAYGNPESKVRSELLYRINVEYKEQQGSDDSKLYLNYISFENVFRLNRPAAFRIDNLVLDLNRRELEIWLNVPPAEPEELSKSTFQVEFLGRKVPIEDVVFDPNKNTLRLIVDRGKLNKRHVQLLFSPDFEVSSSKLIVTAKRLRDAEGNKLGERDVEDLRQFREFFTQQVVPYRNGVREAWKMNKEIPLFDPEQPIYPLEGQSQFWMNTPLPKRN
ncbi:carboxypeptidase-like regulatory domain-containing protein [Aureicoccus marinus]|nr:carboxypeptidase-like regulatory domain-containing protein [Aureicoccus marinus]